MKAEILSVIFGILLVGMSLTMTGSSAFAHCDGLDGPVVQAAENPASRTIWSIGTKTRG